MDWIERWFNVSPDGGDGSLELLIVAVLALVIVGLLSKHAATRRPSHALFDALTNSGQRIGRRCANLARAAVRATRLE